MMRVVTHKAISVTAFSWMTPKKGFKSGRTKAVSEARIMFRKKSVIPNGISTRMPDIMRARRCLLKADCSGVSLLGFIGPEVRVFLQVSVLRFG